MSASGFIWYELLADDAGAAARFYVAVLGWQARDSGMPGKDYRFVSTGETDIGGLLTLTPEAKAMGARPQWLPYVNVTDVDAAVDSTLEAGGTLHMTAMEIPGTGRFAMVVDPQSAPFYVMAPIGAGPSPSFHPGRYGHGGWHELHTRNWRAAREFYGALFGWGTALEMDLGAMGTYLQFNAGAGPAIGGMMEVADIGRPFWLIYFNVDGIEAAKRRLVAAGGTLNADVHQVPGDDWILRARDPQGAAFALIGPRWEKHRPV